MEQRTRRAVVTLAALAASILCAFVAARSGLVSYLNGKTGDLFVLSAFFSGGFFTSIFTTAPAMVVLGTLAKTHSPFIVALIGAAGALCGDLLIFRFFRDRLSEDFAFLLDRARSKRLRDLANMRVFRWLMPLLGALVIASPLPDELGLLILGISRMPRRLFVPMSFTFNFLGILLLGLIARGMSI